MAYNHDKERIDLPPPLNSNRNGSPLSFAPAKEFKTVNNSTSRVIRVLIDKPEDSVVQFGTGSNAERTQNTRGS